MSDESAAREVGTHQSRDSVATVTGRSATPAESARLEHTAGRVGLRIVAWLAWTLSLAFTALALRLDYLTPYIPQRGPAAFPSAFAVLYATLSLAYPTVGALIALRRPGNSIGWIFCGAGFVIAFQAFAMAYADYTLYGEGSLPGAEFAAWISGWINFPVAALSTILLLLLFPSGRLPSRMLFPDGRVPEDRIWRNVVWAAVCGSVMDAFRYATWPGPLDGYPSVANPAGIDGAIGIFLTTLLGGGATLLLLVSLVFALVSLVNRLMLARGRERQQIKWVAFSAALLVSGFLGAVTGDWYRLREVLWFLGTLGYFLFPFAVGIAVLRYRLWDIDLIVNRALVYGTLTATVVGAYALVVGGLGALAQARDDLAVALLAAGVVAVLVQPLRTRLQRSVDRLIVTARPAAQEPPESRDIGRMAFVGIGARGAARLAWMVWGLSLAVIFAYWWLSFINVYSDFWKEPVYLAVLFNALLLVFSTIGAFVAARRPENPIGWLFCTMSLAFSLQLLTSSYADYALLEGPDTFPLVEVVAWLSNWVAFPVIMPVAALLFLLFPDGHLPSRRWRVVAWAAVAGGVLLAAGDALMPGPLYDQPGVNNPLGVGGVIGGMPASRVWETCAMGGIWLLLGSCLVSVVSLVLRLRRARGEERRQIAWFASAAAIMPTGFLAGFFIQWGPINDIGYFVGIFGFLMLPVTAAVAILRHRLWDIDLILNRTLVYGALTAVVVGAYALVVGALSTLLQTSAGEGLLVPVLATGLIAVLFTPARNRLQRSVNRLMYGDRDDPYVVLSRLGKRLESTLAPGAVLPGIVETVAQTLKLPYAAISLRQGDGFETAAEYGTPPDEPVVLPLTYGTETVGRFVLAPRAPGEPFTASDLRLLEDLARQVGVAAYAVRLTADLQRSRERLVNTREEERRRLRRDLHDGLGPQLATFTLKLDAARNLLASEPEAAGSLLLELKNQTQDTISGIRRLAYELRPPALDELGLVSALREQATTYGPAFSIEAPEQLPPLPAAVEVAAYRIAVEAMTNTERHARARVCRVRIEPSDGTLELDVSDDGVGLPDDHRAGVGLASMRERAAEIGGTCEIEAVPAGGTRVLARLPLEASGFRHQEKATSRRPGPDVRTKGGWGDAEVTGARATIRENRDPKRDA